MKKQLLICFSAFVVAAAAVSAPQSNHGKLYSIKTTANDTIPGNNKTNASDSAKQWNTGTENRNDTLYPHRDSAGHPNLDTMKHSPR
jgi:hypothetical protein